MSQLLKTVPRPEDQFFEYQEIGGDFVSVLVTTRGLDERQMCVQVEGRSLYHNNIKAIFIDRFENSGMDAQPYSCAREGYGKIDYAIPAKKLSGLHIKETVWGKTHPVIHKPATPSPPAPAPHKTHHHGKYGTLISDSGTLNML